MMKSALVLAFFLWPACALAQGPVLEMKVQPPVIPSDEAEAPPQAEMVCRPPQRMTSTRRLGPTVCRTKAQWDEIHAKGLDIAADGRGYVQSEKYRNIQMCGQGSC